MTYLTPIIFTSGMIIYKYQIISKIGAGSFGEVWLAYDLAIKKKYAIKILRPGVSMDQRLREAQIGNRLEHPNLVHVYQADVVNLRNGSNVILAMDYQEKGSIKVLANRANYLPLPTVLSIARDILQGLEYLHAQKFYHNDIKPGNILLGTHGQAMLSDYGITGISTNGGPVIAQHSYIYHSAPEVVSTGNIGVSSDIFQVGMTLARLLIGLDFYEVTRSRIGEIQFEKDITAGTLLKSTDFECHIPSAVQRIILKAVNPDPAQRYHSAIDMRRVLEKLNYPGYWTVNDDRKEVGNCKNYEFSYLITPISSKKFDVTCSKRNIISGITQRVTRFCKSDLNEKQKRKVISDFKKYVVIGK